MSITEKRKIGERGQITIPKRIREKEGIRGGDEVSVRDENGSIVIKKERVNEELKEAYEEMAARDKKISEEMINATDEALE